MNQTRAEHELSDNQVVGVILGFFAVVWGASSLFASIWLGAFHSFLAGAVLVHVLLFTLWIAALIGRP